MSYLQASLTMAIRNGMGYNQLLRGHFTYLMDTSLHTWSRGCLSWALPLVGLQVVDDPAVEETAVKIQFNWHKTLTVLMTHERDWCEGHAKLVR